MLLGLAAMRLELEHRPFDSRESEGRVSSSGSSEARSQSRESDWLLGRESVESDIWSRRPGPLDTRDEEETGLDGTAPLPPPPSPARPVMSLKSRASILELYAHLSPGGAHPLTISLSIATTWRVRQTSSPLFASTTCGKGWQTSFGQLHLPYARGDIGQRLWRWAHPDISLSSGRTRRN